MVIVRMTGECEAVWNLRKPIGVFACRIQNCCDTVVG